mgnify:CR=1 FL=1|jgi:hypothetical protein
MMYMIGMTCMTGLVGTIGTDAQLMPGICVIRKLGSA